ncbi:hypothetical protein M378DRAFT_157304 [Amanita muscaria Koide BX008]|uniref:Serine-threonine/tyrosine-protein kinase catalytic domain-containing protein n=1 Tax=Amanita muscaria (strain Koide BX008) TaxID=946122 RepID=A0A0C2TPE3_AMAMK|nr:hypothetical protein M378DRAFT_157304 [Amanita muscaria Koide BX008]
MGIVLHDFVDSGYIFLDSEFHAKFLFLGLIAHYVKVTPIANLNQMFLSHEANIYFFGCLFYEMCFGFEIEHFERIYCTRDTVAKRPLEPEIRDDVWQLIQRCCAEEPKRRPTMDDIVREMEAWDIT